jgi:carboxynorspermidine decarboxylase
MDTSDAPLADLLQVGNSGLRQRAIRALADADLQTPAFVYDEAGLLANIQSVRAAIQDSRVELLFALKAFTVEGGLRRISPYLDGFHVSSLFEARLAREILADSGIVHFTAPSIRSDEAEAIVRCSDMISFNSFSQWQSCRHLQNGWVRVGLRVNPQLSFLDDERYDPCRRHSKLGEPISRLAKRVREDPASLDGISGILVHNNCESRDFAELRQTIERIETELAPLLERIDWINLGGGYLFQEGADPGPLKEIIPRLQSEYGLGVLMEPGAAIAQGAGYLVTTVVDLFESEGREVAVLDTSVNHVPEVFEYQTRLDVAGAGEGRAHPYILAGATCLAGDVFGVYAFDERLTVGARLIVANRGAYSLVKANMFNGVNLPAIYGLATDGQLTLKRRFSYEDFLGRCGVA